MSISIRLPSAPPWPGLPDSIDALASMAARLQSAITLAFNHPIWAVVAVVFTIGLLQILADLVKRLIKTSVTFVLKIPLALSQWLWKRATNGGISKEARIDQLIDQLDTLRAEQDQVMTELKSLLSQSKDAQYNQVVSVPKKQLSGFSLSGKTQSGKTQSLKDASEEASATELSH